MDIWMLLHLESFILTVNINSKEMSLPVKQAIISLKNQPSLSERLKTWQFLLPGTI